MEFSEWKLIKGKRIKLKHTHVEQILTHTSFTSAQLEKVPILGFGLIMGQHVVIDRSNRRSQINTLKSGIACLKNGIHLVAFPEGTRSRTGRMLPLKRGAFKMADISPLDAKMATASAVTPYSGLRRHTAWAICSA